VSIRIHLQYTYIYSLYINHTFILIKFEIFLIIFFAQLTKQNRAKQLLKRKKKVFHIAQRKKRRNNFNNKINNIYMRLNGIKNIHELFNVFSGVVVLKYIEINNKKK